MPPGKVFGELAILYNCKRTATIKVYSIYYLHYYCLLLCLFTKIFNCLFTIFVYRQLQIVNCGPLNDNVSKPLCWELDSFAKLNILVCMILFTFFVCLFVYNFSAHSGPENFKKSRPKKLMKSNKSISRKKSFFAISKMTKNLFLNWKKV